jgi:DNA segregation ATPase FtsK/SpoIIIE, S-DNA-T family
MPDESSTSSTNKALGTAFAVLSALGLVSVFLALLSPEDPGFIGLPGAFLAGAFSWAAFFVPLWLAAASALAFLPGWRPGAVVALGLSVLPFVPIALVARISSAGEELLTEHPGLEALGFPALVAAAVSAALILSVFVAYASRAIAGLAEGGQASSDKPVSPEGRPRVLQIEAPAGAAVTASAAASSPIAAPAPTEESKEDVPDAEPVEAHFVFRVPELPPLPRLASLEDELPELESLPEFESEPESLPKDEAATRLVAEPTPEAAPSPAAVKPAERAEPRSVDELGIEFTSVPPLHAQLSPEEAAKAAALERVLARRKEKDKPYVVPAEGILTSYPDGEYWIIDEKTKHSAEMLRECLAEFKIEAEVTGIRKGPVITMFEILPAPGVKLSKITNLADNIALRLAASSVRIVAPIPGKHAVGIEVPNASRSIVSLRELVEAESFKAAKMEIPVVLGKDISGEAQFLDLAQTPHLLIAGATGSGKSVCVNAMILSVLFRRSPNDVKLLLIDPKIVELKLYNDIPHLLTPVITEPKRAFQALQYCICEMERRYSLLDHAGVRDIKSYNRKIKDKKFAAEKLPYIVVIIDEFADLMATTGKELESTLARLAAMSRAVGIHLVLATQRPSIDVITGLIKANIPSRIAFMVASKFDSRIIIDMVGAEKLLGRGDMLVATAWDPFPIRMQGAFVSEEEVEKAVEFVKTLGEPEYIDDEIFFDDEDEEDGPSLFGDEDDDPLFEKALEIVLQQGKASASYIQRRLKVGYNRASRLVEIMEEKGIVGPPKGSKPRDLVHNPDVLGRSSSGASRVAEGGASRAAGAKQPSLMPGLETVPGQRVTGRDEVASGEVASGEITSGEDTEDGDA